MAHDAFSKQLLAWFDRHGRKHLPWQQRLSDKQSAPYRVWLSEIMLQQTQVSTVVPYFETFTSHYPTVQHLARAPLDDVLHLWSGLGYYARARNLHKTAVIVATEHKGKFPGTVEALEQLPGIGRSTAGAIAAIAFRKRAVILDGNVKRVLARYHGVRGAVDSNKTLQQLWQLAEQHTPDTRIAQYTQAIMDLGATLCTRTKPRCEECPLKSGCVARKLGKPTAFPQKKSRRALPQRETQMLLLVNSKREVLLQQRPPTGIWGGLWSFPELAPGKNPVRWCKQELGFNTVKRAELPVLAHTFSHYRLQIHPILLELKVLELSGRRPARALRDGGQQLWYKLHPGSGRPRLGLPVPASKLLKQLASHYRDEV